MEDLPSREELRSRPTEELKRMMVSVRKRAADLGDQPERLKRRRIELNEEQRRARDEAHRLTTMADDIRNVLTLREQQDEAAALEVGMEVYRRGFDADELFTEYVVEPGTPLVVHKLGRR